ncbi:MAG: isocitrate/isopropylmalate family dehydrogenase [Planctomycetaceae bacterium]
MTPLCAENHSPTRAAAPGRWAHLVASRLNAVPAAGYTIGVLKGEGIGPEVIDAALTVLGAVQSINRARKFNVSIGGSIGHDAVRECGRVLSPEVYRFCSEVFGAGGAILAGPGGGRFVYDMRHQFDLFCKLNPLVSCRELQNVGCLKPEHTAEVDILVVRENLAGIYQGRWDETTDNHDGRIAHHRFSYSESQVRRVMKVAAAIAQHRRRHLTLVLKPSGVPTISRLWSDSARDVAREFAVHTRELEIDYAAFQLIQNPREFDVVVTSNMFGDIMSDVGGLLLGSRGICYGGSFSETGAAVYQTNHGAANDLARADRANPVGQIFALAMLLRQSFGLSREADLIEAAVAHVWRRGIRTADVCENGSRIVGTRQMADCIADAVVDLAKSRG